MPTYEYACKSCGHAFELLQGFNDPVVKKCPRCSKPKAERLFSGGGGFIFKGSGFYETDYKKSSDSESKAEKPESKADVKTETKSDATPSGDAPKKPEKSPKSETKPSKKPKK